MKEVGLGRCNILKKLAYLDKHLNSKHSCKNVIGCGQKSSFLRVGWNVRSFHSQGDAVQSNEKQDYVVEPTSRHHPCAKPSHAEICILLEFPNEVPR